MRHGEALICEILTCTRAIARADATVRSSLDLSMPQLEALFCLAASGPTTAGELASPVGLRRPAGSHLLDPLAQAWFASRLEQSDHRRRTLLYSTPRGESLIAQLREWSHAEQLPTWLTSLTESEVDALATGVRALARAVDAGARTGTRPSGRVMQG